MTFNHPNITNVTDIYKNVISDVISQVKESIFDENIDLEMLTQFKEAWEAKVDQIKEKNEEAYSRSPQSQQTEDRPPISSGINANVDNMQIGDGQDKKQPETESAVQLDRNLQQPILSQDEQQKRQRKIKLSHRQIDRNGNGDGDANVELDELDEEMVELQQYANADSSGNVPAEPVPDENPLNSEDDMSSDDEDMDRLFQSNDKFLCQFEKVYRAKNTWKFHLKAGIMHFKNKDIAFQKATGDVDWKLNSSSVDKTNKPKLIYPDNASVLDVSDLMRGLEEALGIWNGNIGEESEEFGMASVHESQGRDGIHKMNPTQRRYTFNFNDRRNLKKLEIMRPYASWIDCSVPPLDCRHMQTLTTKNIALLPLDSPRNC
ncbi:hypothetical protein WR25_07935 [Diploscapter pachys]|uniref:Uncharacterized protein n=1 Tax=Diploscapter pachys TaxID=2018661 RepID=A0A2A2KK10_9BILA|nr:hypothetical protein WR25_07935 [Diploscapter pachys]